MYFNDGKGIDIWRDSMKVKSSAPSLTHRRAASMRTRSSSHRKYSSISLALKKFLSRSKFSGISIGTEYASLAEATDRILADCIRCPIAIPPFQRSTVDGFAVMSSDTKKATKDHHATLKVIGKIGAGKSSGTRISSGKAAAIAT